MEEKYMPVSAYSLTGTLNNFLNHKSAIMINIRKLFIAMLLVAVPSLLSAQDKNKVIETVKYKTSIDCNNCVNKIMTNLPQEKGIKDVNCDLSTKEVTVTYQKDKNNPDDIKKAIEKLGYTAKVVTGETEEKKEK